MSVGGGVDSCVCVCVGGGCCCCCCCLKKAKRLMRIFSVECANNYVCIIQHIAVSGCALYKY